MSDPDDIPRRRPPRAEPIQPDKPASGIKKEDSDSDASLSKSAEKQKEQSEPALDNVRNP